MNPLTQSKTATILPVLIALAAIMPGVCFGGHRWIPRPNPASICAHVAFQTPPPVNGQPFVSPTTINGFVFTDLAPPPPDSTAIYRVDPPNVLGIRFDPRGLEILLPQKSFYAVVELAVLSTDVVVEGFDSANNLLFSMTIPPTGFSTTMATLSGPNKSLAKIRLTGGITRGRCIRSALGELFVRLIRKPVHLAVSIPVPYRGAVLGNKTGCSDVVGVSG